jgi:hypothetical protein
MYRRLQYLYKGRMGVDYASEFFQCGLAAYECSDFLDDIGRMGTIHMAAKYSGRQISLDYKLAETVCLPHRHGLAVGTEE